MVGPWISNEEQRLIAGFGGGQRGGPRLDFTVFFLGVAVFFLLGVACYGLLVPEKWSGIGGLVVVYVGLAAFCFVLQREYRPRLSQFGLSRATLLSRRTLAWSGVGLALTGAELGFIYGLSYFVSVTLPPHRAPIPGLQPFGQTVRQPFGFLITVAIGPVLEELFIRGYLYLLLRQNWGRRRAALISSGIFAVLHAGVPLLAAILFAVSLAYIYLDNKAESLAPSIAAHASYNFVLGIIMFT